MEAQVTFGEAIEQVRPALFARASRMVGVNHYGAGAPKPEDLVQSTLLRLYQREASEALGPSPSADTVRRYAFRVLHNAFVDACCRKKRELLARPSNDGPGLPELTAPGDPESMLLAKESFTTRQRMLVRAMASLDDRERAFLKACFMTGSAPQAQKEVGWPPGTAANACKRRNSIVQRLQRWIADSPPQALSTAREDRDERRQ